MNIEIAHLYPDLLNLYGDRGNIIALKKRCEWRSIDVNVTEYKLNDKIDFEKTDILFIGGGSDREQLLVCKKLLEMKEDVKNYVESNGVLIAICGGYQLLGHYYKCNDENIEGLSVLDITTTSGEGRLINNVVIKSPLFERPIVGFENHGGRTYINNHKPFGEVLYGKGNNGEDSFEGVHYKNVIGTYLHGPLFPKNPHLCDYLIEKALERKYNKEISLPKLDDETEFNANDYIVNRFIK